MGANGVEQRVVGERRIAEAKLVKGRALSCRIWRTVSPAVSQRVNAKSITGAPGAAYSSQLFERKSSVGKSKLSSTLSAKGLTSPLR